MSRLFNRSLFAGLSAIALVACGNANGDNPTASPTSGPETTTSTAIGHIKGDEMAEHVLIEYASPTCGHCKTFHDEMYPALAEKYISTSKIKFEFREFPLNQIDVAAYAVANCVGGDDKFFAVLDDLFENQHGILAAAKEGVIKQTLLTLAQKHGIADEEALNACLANKDVLNRISDTMMSGETHEVNSTPTFVLDGKPFQLTGAVRTGDDFVALLDEKLGIESTSEAAVPAETQADTPAEVEAE
ncbi:MAG: DsbA family protein [Hyphomonas sp.]